MPWGQGPLPSKPTTTPTAESTHGNSLQEDYGLIRRRSLPRLRRGQPGQGGEKGARPPRLASAPRLCTRLLGKPSARPVPVTRRCAGLGPSPHMTPGGGQGPFPGREPSQPDSSLRCLAARSSTLPLEAQEAEISQGRWQEGGSALTEGEDLAACC